MNLETYTRAQMARFAIEEGARHGGIQNMIAILHVLRNRVFKGWGDWTEVALKAHEKRGTIYPDEFPNLRTNNVRIILSRVDEVYARTDLIDVTGGALFYFDSNLAPVEWFKQEILGNSEDHPRVCHIGPVWFFK